MTQVIAAPPARPRSHHTVVRDLLEIFVIALVLYVAISFAFQPVRVDGTSMLPTLHDQDLLLATKLPYHLHDPQRGDIVVLIPPDAADAGKDFIKRIIGLPGDLLEIDGKYVDPAHPDQAPAAAILVKPGDAGAWQRVDEGYLAGPWVSETFCCRQGANAGMESIDNQPHPLLIPPGEYFVLGDNRNASKDSRFIGLVPRANILAEAWIRLAPVSAFGPLGNGPTLVPALMLPPGILRLLRRRRRTASRASLTGAES